MDRKSRLSEAKRLFAQYKSAMGSALSKDDLVHKYLKEIEISIDREDQRVKAEKERAKREEERAKAKEAADKAAEEAKKSEGEKPVEKDGEKPEKKEESAPEDDGWY
jgi:isopropylmalate/homocitrate/citramalate synthase